MRKSQTVQDMVAERIDWLTGVQQRHLTMGTKYVEKGIMIVVEAGNGWSGGKGRGWGEGGDVRDVFAGGGLVAWT